MAANEYYSGQTSQPYSRPQYLDTRPQNQSPAPYIPSLNTSSIDQSRPLPSAADPRYNDSNNDLPRPSQYSDTIPLTNQQSNTTDQGDWRTQQTRYDNSPGSQTTPPLLPKPKPKKKKKGFFAGKIPWVVYFVSLVQITVFIVEIIKNCKLTTSY